MLLMISIPVKKTGFLFRWLIINKIDPTTSQGTPPLRDTSLCSEDVPSMEVPLHLFLT